MMDRENFMLRAIELAANGLGHTSPNPMVGCVITRQNLVIGEGWHRKFGEAHAEVNAIDQVSNPEWLKESEMYVTLEPCSHFGKTPPCSDLIIGKGIPSVYVSQIDPNPVVNGKGIQKLREAGVRVETGFLEDQARTLNKRYLTALQENRPYIVLKWAQTLDNFIAHENYDSKWISHELSRQLVHKWRSQEDAVLVGFNTARYDNPRLNVRNWTGRDPVRIVIDKTLELPKDLKIFDTDQHTIILNTQIDQTIGNVSYIQAGPENFLCSSLQHLREIGVHSVMVEGGRGTLSDFINQGVWDEARIFTGNQVFNSGIRAPELKDRTLIEKKETGDDMLFVFKRNNSL